MAGRRNTLPAPQPLPRPPGGAFLLAVIPVSRSRAAIARLVAHTTTSTRNGPAECPPFGGAFRCASRGPSVAQRLVRARRHAGPGRCRKRAYARPGRAGDKRRSLIPGRIVVDATRPYGRSHRHSGICIHRAVMMSPLRCQSGRGGESEDSKTNKNGSGHSQFLCVPQEHAEKPIGTTPLAYFHSRHRSRMCAGALIPETQFHSATTG